MGYRLLNSGTGEKERGTGIRRGVIGFSLFGEKAEVLFPDRGACLRKEEVPMNSL